jgi:hypothetical protein
MPIGNKKNMKLSADGDAGHPKKKQHMAGYWIDICVMTRTKKKESP